MFFFVILRTLNGYQQIFTWEFINLRVIGILVKHLYNWGFDLYYYYLFYKANTVYIFSGNT